MVGDHPVRDRMRPVGVGAGGAGRGEDQVAEQVDLVVVVGALHHRRDPLQPHAGVDRRLRQVDALLARHLLVLHEHQVPDLDEAVALGVRAARRAARNVLAVVVEDLRAWAARAGLAHRPEVVGGRNADDLAVRQAGDLAPQVEGFVVLGIDGDQQPLGRHPEFLGDQLPGELDRQILEVVAEREVAQHLEERVVPGGVADVLQVVVLAAGAHALLRRRGAQVVALLGAGEDVLELHHAGVGEHQRRIVARHQRARRHDAMPVPGEEVEERLADVVDGLHAP